ncbi:MAG: hypothetical protein PHN88_15980 [Ignavibacteria bacterium]|nr:hypothetical protein [Ignavibacteria bacterium]
MIYAATIVSAGIINPDAFVVKPQYTRIDGTDALNIEALPLNGLFPTVGDIVFLAEGINDFEQSMQLIINKNGGAFPLIFASLASPIIFKVDMQVIGKVKLGQGTKKMVLGNDLQTWAQAKDAEIAALYAWAATGVAPGPTGGIAPFPGTPAETNWNTATLSENHLLD